jgi:hypothetical protein
MKWKAKPQLQTVQSEFTGVPLIQMGKNLGNLYQQPVEQNHNCNEMKRCVLVDTQGKKAGNILFSKLENKITSAEKSFPATLKNNRQQLILLLLLINVVLIYQVYSSYLLVFIGGFFLLF